MIKFNLLIRHCKRLTIITNKIEQSEQYTVVKFMWLWSLLSKYLIIVSFSLKRSTLQLLLSTHGLPASLLLCFGAIMKENKRK